MRQGEAPTHESQRPHYARDAEELQAGDYYQNLEELFYWMEAAEEGDIPLCALGIDFPSGCRFCI